MKKTASEIANEVLVKVGLGFGIQGDFRDKTPEEYRDAIIKKQNVIGPILAGVTTAEGAGIGALLAHALGRRKGRGALLGAGIGAGIGGGAALADNVIAKRRSTEDWDEYRKMHNSMYEEDDAIMRGS